MKVVLNGPEDFRVRRLLRDLNEIEGIDASMQDLEDGAHTDLTIGLHPSVDDQLIAARNSVESGSHYISASGGSDVVEALTTAFSGTSGPAVFVGADWTPAITCAVAVRAGLERVDQIRISWLASAAGPTGYLAVEKVLQAFSSRAVVFEAGSWRRVRAAEESEQVFMPEPVGWREVWNCAGSESLLLPTAHPHLSRVIVRGAASEPIVSAVVRKAANIDPRKASRLLRQVLRLPLRDSLGLDAGWSAARVDLYGERNRSYAFLDQLSNLSVLPLLAIVKSWKTVSLEAKARPLHEALSPEEFLDALVAQGLQLARLDPGTRTMS